MKDLIFLFTKDCMSIESMPCYGGCKYWEGKMPNVDELAEKGTKFLKHYTAAPSTAMAMSAMLTGHYPYEFQRKSYTSVFPNEYPSIYSILQEQGYETHLIWDFRWMKMAWPFVREFGNEKLLILHNLKIGQPAGNVKKGVKRLERNDELLLRTKDIIYKELSSITISGKQFIWLHLPHVLYGRRSYMDDMDVVDEILGFVRKMVGDENLYFSTDHGHMNMHRQKVCYGFDLYEPAIHIPLITPRINGIKEVRHITSNIDLPSIILDGVIPSHNHIIAETKYYAQAKRKIAVVSERFKYIYNDEDRSEELYDLEWDPQENYNILLDRYYDKDRGKILIFDELYFYPYRDEALAALRILRDAKNKIWKIPSLREKISVRLRNRFKKIKNLTKNF